MNHPDLALQQEVRRLVEEARATILDKILLGARTYLHDYLSCYEKRYGPLEQIPKGSVIRLDEFEDMHPGGSTSFHEIFIKAFVEACGSVITRSMKMELYLIADQMEVFMEYTTVKYGIQTFYDTCMDFLTLQIRKYIGSCEAIQRFHTYCMEHDGNPPRIPAGPHYPF